MSNPCVSPQSSADPFPASKQSEVSEDPTSIEVEERALNTLARLRYQLWLEQDVKSRQDPPRPLQLSILGWSGVLLDHRISVTRRLIQKRIEIFGQVAAEHLESGMLSQPNIESLKKDLQNSVEFAKLAFLDCLHRMFAAEGNVSEFAATAMRQSVPLAFDRECLGLISTSISALEAEAIAKRYQRPLRAGELPGQDHLPAMPAASDHSIGFCSVRNPRYGRFRTTGRHLTPLTWWAWGTLRTCCGGRG